MVDYGVSACQSTSMSTSVSTHSFPLADNQQVERRRDNSPEYIFISNLLYIRTVAFPLMPGLGHLCGLSRALIPRTIKTRLQRASMSITYKSGSLT
jgi:hypothetical protein